MGQHFQRGQILFDLKRYAEAIAEYRLNLAEDATCVVSRANIASSLFNLNRLAEAADAARDAISSAPEYAHSYYVLACVHDRMGKGESALRDINEAIRLAPSALYFFKLAGFHYAAKQFKNAFAATTSALELDANFTSALLLRASILRSLDQTAESEQILQELLRSDPENAAVHQAIGNIALQQRDNQAAWNFLHNAAQIDPVGHLSLDKLAAAQGRKIWPICVIDQALRQLEAWKSFRRWAFVACLTTCALFARLLANPTSSFATYSFIVTFVVIANLMLILWSPWMLDVPAALLEKLRNRRQHHYGWGDFFGRDFRRILGILLIAVIPVSFLAIQTAMSPALTFAMAIIVVNYELQFSIKNAFPKYGFIALISASALVWCIAMFGADLIVAHPFSAIGLWTIVVAASASGPLYFRPLATRHLASTTN